MSSAVHETPPNAPMRNVVLDANQFVSAVLVRGSNAWNVLELARA